ncbi:hypothetical protein KL86PLE_90194 [uncultured Pleomorphomonas sp.]|uniref:Uncharacterized protein n=1 Tax=uncultured Pleomorphomonas sp. TaxID=442121 RepID=A0A212LNB9_9HYPH|nr:hypothetical protein KL86PLE_90194 [uncultured Pleomorphomonas sp.]
MILNAINIAAIITLNKNDEK